MTKIKNIFLGILPLSLMLLAGCKTILPPQNGVRVNHHINGQLESVAEYKNGKLNGIKRVYDTDGNLKTAIFYENGRMTMLNIYYPDGLLWMKEIYEDGRLAEKREYDRQGTLVSKDNFR